ncbi:MAG: hypothetical protein QOE06_3212 [Thermoleophilaceae bacterium]|jgi:uncharacterized membrane protein (DUF485 family)|nr:hypothetical protein [Thermoleophilaceae bacterium]
MSTESPAATGVAADSGHRIDWEAAERSPEFGELVRRRRGFVLPATIFTLCWYFGFILLAGYAPDFMGRKFLVDGLTVGYTLALSQFVMVWALCWAYLRRADRVFDPLAEAAARRAIEAAETAEPRAGGRFERAPAADQRPELHVPGQEMRR